VKNEKKKNGGKEISMLLAWSSAQAQAHNGCCNYLKGDYS
jgi:hypothetical protein